MIAKKPDPLIQFMADPKFQEQYDESAGKLTLSSPLVTYASCSRPVQTRRRLSSIASFPIGTPG